MKLTEWLNNEAGRATKLASHMGRSISAISQWRINGVPVDLMKSVRDFSHGEVGLEDMVPDTTPNKEQA